MSTRVERFHQTYPGMPDLFHTYCDEHPEFGTCADEAQAHRDIADHIDRHQAEGTDT